MKNCATLKTVWYLIMINRQCYATQSDQSVCKYNIGKITALSTAIIEIWYFSLRFFFRILPFLNILTNSECQSQQWSTLYTFSIMTKKNTNSSASAKVNHRRLALTVAFHLWHVISSGWVWNHLKYTAPDWTYSNETEKNIIGKLTRRAGAKRLKIFSCEIDNREEK